MRASDMCKCSTYLVSPCAIVWQVRYAELPIAIIVASGLLFFPYPNIQGVPVGVERDHSSVTRVEGSSSLVDSLPGINQSPRNAAMLSVMITTPETPLTIDNTG